MAIETLALLHDGVIQAACVPVPDVRLGERICIAINGPVEIEDLLAHLAAEGLSKYDMPEFYVRLQDFPLTDNGKVLKRDLAAQVRRGEITPKPCRIAKGSVSASARGATRGAR